MLAIHNADFGITDSLVCCSFVCLFDRELMEKFDLDISLRYLKITSALDRRMQGINDILMQLELAEKKEEYKRKVRFHIYFFFSTVPSNVRCFFIDLARESA
jgi:hypothetical protein